jgi:hypothetical protein
MLRSTFKLLAIAYTYSWYAAARAAAEAPAAMARDVLNKVTRAAAPFVEAIKRALGKGARHASIVDKALRIRGVVLTPERHSVVREFDTAELPLAAILAEAPPRLARRLVRGWAHVLEIRQYEFTNTNTRLNSRGLLILRQTGNVGPTGWQLTVAGICTIRVLRSGRGTFKLDHNGVKQM